MLETYLKLLSKFILMEAKEPKKGKSSILLNFSGKVAKRKKTTKDFHFTSEEIGAGLTEEIVEAFCNGKVSLSYFLKITGNSSYVVIFTLIQINAPLKT